MQYALDVCANTTPQANHDDSNLMPTSRSEGEAYVASDRLIKNRYAVTVGRLRSNRSGKDNADDIRQLRRVQSFIRHKHPQIPHACNSATCPVNVCVNTNQDDEELSMLPRSEADVHVASHRPI
jgi:hypothetical protein